MSFFDLHHHRNNEEKKLTLFNFEDNDAFNYPYILTSPRSLKACRLAEIKPIELLHRSVEDIALDLNLSMEYAHQIYADYENKRSRKLEICKLIRKHLITAEAQNKLYDATNSIKTYYNEEDSEKFNNLKRSTPDLPSNIQRSQSFSPTSVQFNSLRKSNKKCMSPSKRYSSRIQFDNKIKSRNNSSERTSSPNKMLHLNPSMSVSPNMENKNEKCFRKTKFKKPSNDQQLCWQVDKMKTLNNNSVNKVRISSNDSETDKFVRKSPFKNNVKSEGLLRRNSTIITKSKTSNQKQLKQNSGKSSEKNHESKTKVDTRSLEKKRNEKFNDAIKNKHSDMNLNSNNHQNISKCIPNSCAPTRTSIKNHDLRILDAMFLTREKQQLEKQFSKKADIVWDTPCDPIVRINYPYQNLQEVCNTCNENVAFNAYLQQIKNKMKQLKENSFNKELHREQVRQLAQELQAGMEIWQDHVLLLQWRALQRAKINAKLNLESKRLKTQTENNERALLHALRFRNVQDLERIKQQIMKKEIEDKNCRIERFKMKREQEILDCKAQALYTAELRNQLRKTLTPETFDKKVNDAIIQSQFINRSLTASPFIESHIRLG